MVRRAALWSVALWPLCAAQQGAPNDAAAPPVRCNESWIRGPGRLGRYGIVTSYNHRPKVDKYQRMRLNKLCYAQRHGYTFIEEKNVGWSHSCVAGAGPCKITQVVRWLPRFDWLLWYDLDIAITNPGPGVFEALTARNASDGMPLFTAEPGAAWRPFEADFARARGPAEWAAWLRSYAPVRALDVDDGVAVILTDHSIAINAGAVLIRNSANGRAFARRWLGVMRQVHPNLPFRDNGALLEAVAMASPEYLARGRPCLAIGEAEALKGEDEHQKVFDFFNCYAEAFAAASRPYTGTGDRRVGETLFVEPRARGFNAHTWKPHKRTAKHWARSVTWDRHAFGLHDKRDSLVPLESTRCGLPLRMVQQGDSGYVLHPTPANARPKVCLFGADRGVENKLKRGGA
ncbi:hypothetical protein M885DRAFT_544774 [Pelagophyceae sp. CCMP2097]|nr:hypothetical protein M885DRAFT_544774 [Pelagophyceae sp. CCMP2097]